MSNAINAGDTAWVLISTALVMLMTPALGFFYGGLVRRKNVLSTIMHSFFMLALISVQWVLWGYSLAFGPDTNAQTVGVVADSWIKAFHTYIDFGKEAGVSDGSTGGTRIVAAQSTHAISKIRAFAFIRIDAQIKISPQRHIIYNEPGSFWIDEHFKVITFS